MSEPFEDYYEILGVPQTVTQDALSKAYKKMALKTHPDRNTNDPKAAERFRAVQQAYEILNDEKARAAFDNVLKARLQKRKRESAMDASLRQMKADLEQKEQAFKKQKMDEETAKRWLEIEKERLKREAALRIKAEKERREKEEQRRRQEQEEKASGRAGAALKVRWKRPKRSGAVPPYTESDLNTIFSRFGPIDSIILSRKGGSALVSFKSAHDALLAVSEANSGSLADNPLHPLKVAWAPGHAPDLSSSPSPITPVPTPAPSASILKAPQTATAPPRAHAAFENEVLMRMAKAAALMKQSAGSAAASTGDQHNATTVPQ